MFWVFFYLLLLLFKICHLNLGGCGHIEFYLRSRFILYYKNMFFPQGVTHWLKIQSKFSIQILKMDWMDWKWIENGLNIFFNPLDWKIENGLKWIELDWKFNPFNRLKIIYQEIAYKTQKKLNKTCVTAKG